MGAGRPTKYDESYHPEKFIELSKAGLCKAEICAEWGISRSTIYEWIKNNPEFSSAVKKGFESLEAAYINKGKGLAYGDIKGGNVAAWIWLTKNVLGYADKIEQHNTHTIDSIEFEDDGDDE